MTRGQLEADSGQQSVGQMPADSEALIGRLLGDAREDAGLPQSAAARVLGVPQSRIGKLERGTRRLLFVEAAILAQLYDIDLRQLDPRFNTPRPRVARRKRVDLPRRRLGGERSA